MSFPESPRWRDGYWWISDQLGGEVRRFTEDGAGEQVLAAARTSGLGFAPDSTVMVVTMDPPALLREQSTGRHMVDLSSVCAAVNDMVVDSIGRAYIDAYAAPRAPARILRIDPDDSVHVAAADLAMPNGLALTPDGHTLLVAETLGECITAFDVETGGALTKRRVWARVPGTYPDGLCLDAEGAVWFGSYKTGEYLRVLAGGEITDRIARPGGAWTTACALGGADGRTLLLCSAQSSNQDYAAGRSVGRLETVRVAVAGVGCP